MIKKGKKYKVFPCLNSEGEWVPLVIVEDLDWEEAVDFVEGAVASDCAETNEVNFLFNEIDFV